MASRASTQKITSSQSQEKGTNKRSERIGKGQKTASLEDHADFGDEQEARAYLDKSPLTFALDQVLSQEILSGLLQEIADSEELPRSSSNAIRAVARLLDALPVEIDAVQETIRESVNVQLESMSTDLKEFVADTTQRIDDHVDTKIKELTEAMQKLTEQARATANEGLEREEREFADGVTMNYKRALLRTPPEVDPRLAAKENIRQRQFLLEGITRESNLGKLSSLEAKTVVNKALGEISDGKLRARSALRQNQMGLLVEMESDAGALWLKDPANERALCEALGAGLSFKRRPFSVLALNVTTTIDPENEDLLKEIMEVNGINNGHLAAMRWVKPKNRRNNENPEQKTAHAILTFTDADEANRAILAGLVICHRRLKIVKVKKEPIRCMKCHGWNHVAHECLAKEDTCGHCGEVGSHWTKDCNNKEKLHCVSCKSDTHASWSRQCPVFVKKCEELDKRTPENNLPFFPSKESWTWTPNVSPPTVLERHPPQIIQKEKSQRERKQQKHKSAITGQQLERLSWDRPRSPELDPWANTAGQENPFAFPPFSQALPNRVATNSTVPGPTPPVNTQNTNA